MQIFTDIHTVQCAGPTILTIGNFDGVHLGHQALLRTLTKTAEAHASPDAVTALVTFEPHPLKVLRPDVPLSLLTTPLERMQIAAGIGIDVGVIHPFTRDLAAMTPYEFLTVLKAQLGMTALVVGPDFALGRDRSGTLEALAELSNGLGYQLVVVEHIMQGDRSVRSKTVRGLLADGDVREAASLLGRPYHMAGDVHQGDRRGHQIGIPTANLDIAEDKLWPADGVYATRSWVMEAAAARPYPSVTNIGYRPTVNGSSRRLETHLLDFPAADQSSNLYGLRLAVEFVERLRGEQRFSSVEDLVDQIRADIRQGRQLLESIDLEDRPFFTTPLT
jgi:riboflavin kinase / FMN adenylyltransferase